MVRGKDFFVGIDQWALYWTRWALAAVLADIFPMSFLFNHLFAVLRGSWQKPPGVAVVYDELSRQNFAHRFEENLDFDWQKGITEVNEKRAEEAVTLLTARKAGFAGEKKALARFPQRRTRFPSGGGGLVGGEIELSLLFTGAVAFQAAPYQQGSDIFFKVRLS